MKAQFKDNFTSRDGSTVAVEVFFKQGMTGAMNEISADPSRRPARASYLCQL